MNNEKMSYAKAIRERQHNAIVTNDPKLISIARDADNEISELKKKLDDAVIINNALENVVEDLECELKFVKSNAK